jgi:SAM-dependent methyltransferase
VLWHLRPFYRACYVAGLAENGMLAVLAGGPAPFDDLVARFCPTGERSERDALDAWLDLGVSLRELRTTPLGYVLRGRLSRQLARPENDAALAALRSVVRHHHHFLTEGLGRLRSGHCFTPDDLDGELVARAARVFEPVVREALDAEVPREGPFRVLDVGCGAAGYLGHAALRNRSLTALGLEVQPAVAEAARRNVAAWGVADRVGIRTGDVRDLPAEPAYDLVTLHNNVYYFPVDARVPLLRQLRGFLKPGGRILVTTHCRGSTSGGCLGLFAALTEGCGRLPGWEEMIAQLAEAGFRGATGRQLIPCDAYGAFTGTNGAK